MSVAAVNVVLLRGSGTGPAAARGAVASENASAVVRGRIKDHGREELSRCLRNRRLDVAATEVEFEDEARWSSSFSLSVPENEARADRDARRLEEDEEGDDDRYVDEGRGATQSSQAQGSVEGPASTASSPKSRMGPPIFQRHGDDVECRGGPGWPSEADLRRFIAYVWWKRLDVSNSTGRVGERGAQVEGSCARNVLGLSCWTQNRLGEKNRTGAEQTRGLNANLTRLLVCSSKSPSSGSRDRATGLDLVS